MLVLGMCYLVASLGVSNAINPVIVRLEIETEKNYYLCLLENRNVCELLSKKEFHSKYTATETSCNQEAK
jgi:hypothetical protein